MTETKQSNTGNSLFEKYGDHAKPVEKFGYLMFFLGQNIVFGIMMAALSQFWRTNLAIPLTVSGTMILLARCWDAINDPMLGAFVQSKRPKKPEKGKFRPWAFMTAFALPIVVMLTFIDVNPGVYGEGTASLPVIMYAFIMYIVYGMVYTLCDMPAFAMAITMEPDTKARSQLIVLGRIGASIAGLFTSALFWILVDPEQSTGQPYLLGAAVLSILAMITMSMIYFGKERNQIPSKEPVTFGTMWIFLSENKHIIKLVVIKTIIAFTTAFVYGIVTIVLLSGAIENGANYITLTFTLMSIAVFILSLTIGPIIKKIGKRRSAIVLTLLTLPIIIIGGIWLFTTWNVWAFIVFQMGSLIMMNISIMIGFTFTPEAVEYGTYKTGIRQEAVGQSISSFATKLDMGIAGFFSSFVMAAVGVGAANFTPEAAAAAKSTTFIAFISIILCGVFIITLWGMWWSLNRNDVQKIAILNKTGEIDTALDKKLGIDRAADTRLRNAKIAVKTTRSELNSDDDATINAWIDAKFKLRIEKIAHKEAYKVMRKESRTHKRALKDAKIDRQIEARLNKKKGK